MTLQAVGSSCQTMGEQSAITSLLSNLQQSGTTLPFLSFVVLSNQTFLNIFHALQQSGHQMFPRVKLNIAFYLEQASLTRFSFPALPQRDLPFGSWKMCSAQGSGPLSRRSIIHLHQLQFKPHRNLREELNPLLPCTAFSGWDSPIPKILQK